MNLAAIPFTAIERVEILKDGASAIYGCDAIARRDQLHHAQGLQRRRSDGASTARRRAAVAATSSRPTAPSGIGDLAKDKYNVFARCSYQKQKSCCRSDAQLLEHVVPPRHRACSRCRATRSRATSRPAASAWPWRARIVRPRSRLDNIVSEISTSRCCYDPSHATGVADDPERQAVQRLRRRERSSSTTTGRRYADRHLLDTHETDFVIQPVPISNLFTYGPNDDSRPERSRCSRPARSIRTRRPPRRASTASRSTCAIAPYENGTRDTTDTNEQWQVVAGLKGSVRDWDVDAPGSYNEGNTTEHVLNGGFPRYRILCRCSTAATSTCSAQHAGRRRSRSLRGELHRRRRSTASRQGYGVDAKISGEIFKLPAGPLALAIGMQASKETLDQTFGRRVATAATSPATAATARRPISRSRTPGRSSPS